ncbi:MAG: hypothetical protein COA58_10625 [Bacteroidetes bacterium]|nr:MAG: hypothetical protein COA58_10625 [Bacteroidota bacterium]
MKKSLMKIGVVSIAVGLIASGYINKQYTNEAKDVNELGILDCKIESESENVEVLVEEATASVENNFVYTIAGKHGFPITKEKFEDAKSIKDIIDYYPSSWITNYVSVEILVSCKGEELSVIGADDILSKEQKKILSNADIGTDIVINVKHKTSNPITSEVEDHEMNVSMTIIPEKEAEYVEGYDLLVSYLKENSEEYFSQRDFSELDFTRLIFTINKEGMAENIHVERTSGNDEVDAVLVDLIVEMGEWKPAEDAKGSKVEQEFEFTFGPPGC